MSIKPWIIAVDLDGMLAEPTPPGQYTDAPPIWKNIKKVNALHDKGHRIVIHTARGWYGYDITLTWLNKYRVKFDQIVMGKLHAHAYVDDLNFTLDELVKKLISSIPEEKDENGEVRI